MKINYEKIGSILKLLRMSYCLSQRKLGEKLGVNKTKIYELENGKQVVTYEDLNKYSSFFNIPVTYIICNEEINLNKSKIEIINEILEKKEISQVNNLYFIDGEEISRGILEKYEIDLKHSVTLEKILLIICEDKPDEPGDLRIIKRILKKKIIPFKYLGAFILVLNIKIEELLFNNYKS
ncbi:transcriptional regulator with XRE-family HTH domain [Clostridium moniliforme]|uniref:Transcriptional regulator with XRE-family HTH domain n=1 Tax=Clostridium moniliforme TaxID=39489 RepID=A0ABS4F1I9_9CLOT|nr:helix-turn-helix transcriptional regulator [Clostridium moniliforme]MBP1890122.1 transcriptional regulator with XRE-family HTH domain [Clostridium moniliforme]